jgi:hypothetical protein
MPLDTPASETSAPNADAQTTEQTPAQSAGSAPSGDEWRNPGEIKAALKSIRDLQKLVESQQAALDEMRPKSAKAAAKGEDPVAQLSAQVAALQEQQRRTRFDATLARLAPGLTPAQARLISLAYKAESPSADALEGFVTEQLQALGRAPGQATGAQAERQLNRPTGAPVRTNLGAPASASQQPVNPWTLPAEEVNAMSPRQYRELLNAHNASTAKESPYSRKPPAGAR